MGFKGTKMSTGVGRSNLFTTGDYTEETEEQNANTKGGEREKSLVCVCCMCRPLRIHNHFRHLSIYFSTLAADRYACPRCPNQSPLKYKFKPPRLGTAFIEVRLGKGSPPIFAIGDAHLAAPPTNRKKTRSIAAHDPTPKNQLQVALMNFLPSSSSSSSRLSCFWAQGASVGLPSALAGTPGKQFFGHSVGFCQW